MFDRVLNTLDKLLNSLMLPINICLLKVRNHGFDIIVVLTNQLSAYWVGNVLVLTNMLVRCIKNPVKHLWWSFFMKNTNLSITIFAKIWT